MHYWIAAALLGLAACSTVAPEVAEQRDPARPAPASAPLVLGPWVSFAAGFDADVGADLAAGEASPRTVHGVPSGAPGVVGSALRLGVAGGGAQLDYALAHNADFSKPGALSFWVSGRGWQERTPAAEPYVRFVRVTGRERSVFVIERDTRSGARERIIAGFFDLPGGGEHALLIDAGPQWQRQDWHLIAAVWDSAGFAISVDGAPFTRKSVPGERIAASFGAPDAGAILLLGDYGQEFSLIDEFAVYTRVLADREVAALWQARGETR